MLETLNDSLINISFNLFCKYFDFINFPPVKKIQFSYEELIVNEISVLIDNVLISHFGFKFKDDIPFLLHSLLESSSWLKINLFE
jgi:hypothetical protein